MKDNRPVGRSWKISLVALIGVFIVTMAVCMIVAAHRVSRVVDADYYRHGLRYGETHGRGVAETDGGAVGGKR